MQNVGNPETKEEALYQERERERELTAYRNGEREVEREVCSSRKLPKTGHLPDQYKRYVPCTVAVQNWQTDSRI